MYLSSHQVSGHEGCGPQSPPPADAVDRTIPAAYDIVCTLLSICLLMAATLKGFSSSPTTIGLSPVLHSPPAKFLGIAVESVLAVWLLSGLAKVWARRATLALLMTFILVNTPQLFAGHEDCGCFGALKVHPGWTLLFDLSLFAGIYGLGPNRKSLFARSKNVRWRRAVIATSAALLAGAGAFMISHRWGFHADNATIVFDYKN